MNNNEDLEWVSEAFGNIEQVLWDLENKMNTVIAGILFLAKAVDKDINDTDDFEFEIQK